ncbi:MAG TPA: PQQ-binding-like beta-propeller repeat protein [Vicinamibacterales bacterium]|nr:PQQ-binding-like beta-propeller repeat protein [Vicinamibacterales bacterium]
MRRIISPSSAAAGLAWLGMVAFLSPPAGVAARQRAQSKTAATVEWKTYGADLASTRYSPHDQIDKANFSKLKIAWRLTTNDFGPRPDTLYSATPLFVGNMLYTTVGTTRTVVAINPATGAVVWKHAEDEGPRGQNAARSGAGRGVAYWSAPNGSDQRIIYVTPGYRMLALDAKTGEPISTFGHGGVVDLKLDNDQDLDLVNADVGLNATPLVAGDVIVVGAAHRFSGSPKTMNNTRGYVRGFDVKTGKRLWIFHTVPKPGEYGYDTWLEESADRNGNTGAWAQFSADLNLGLVYIPVEMPTGDYYGGNRPGETLFDESLVALDLKTGTRKWHYQITHHGIWDYDPPCAPVLYDVVVDGRPVRALAQPTKQAFLFVLNRETGKPIWPIEERAVPQSTVPNERTSPTQPFPTRPLPFDRQGVSVDDLIDFTPALRAQALELIKRYKIGPLYTPPSLSNVDGPLATIMVPADTGGANWPGASFDPETNRLYVHSHTIAYLAGIVPANPATSDFGYVAGQARAGGAGARGAAAPAADPDAPASAAPMRGAGGPAAGGRGGTSVQGLPLIKPPYDRITAYDMKTGDILWQKTHSSTPDDIKNNPALQGVSLPPRLGQPGRTFIGTLTTKTLVIAGEGGVHRNEAGERVALLRAYDKVTGADIGAVEMPDKQTGSPMTYMINGKQYIVVAVSGVDGAQLIAYALP